jgi:microcystin-dependent protein
MLISKKDMFSTALRGGFLPQFDSDEEFVTAKGSPAETNDRYYNPLIMAVRRYNDPIWETEGGGVPVGTMFDYGGDAPPPGFLMCNGSAVSREEYANLFAVLGIKYGNGDGINTFNLPNRVNKLSIGAGGVLPVGGNAGAWDHTHNAPNHSHTVSSHQHGIPSSVLGNHQHSIPVTDVGGPNTISVGDLQSWGYTGVLVGGNSTPKVVTYMGNAMNTSGVTAGSGGGVTDGAGAGTDSSGGGATDANNPPFLASNCIIKY